MKPRVMSLAKGLFETYPRASAAATTVAFMALGALTAVWVGDTVGMVAVVLLSFSGGVLSRSSSGRRSALHTPPGSTLNRMAEWIYSRKTFEEVLQPVLSDLQIEYFDALHAGRCWKARWVRIRGYWTFWTHAAMQFPISVTQAAVALWKSVS
jgi:hypothetical protein